MNHGELYKNFTFNDTGDVSRVFKKLWSSGLVFATVFINLWRSFIGYHNIDVKRHLFSGQAVI
jgi:hypothetical protein